MPLNKLNLFKTGFPTFDAAIKGIALGKLSMIAGLEGSGKTTLGLILARQFKKTYSKSTIICYDTENAISQDRLKDLEIKESDIIFPDILFSVETIFKDIEEQVIRIRNKNDAPILILWDSLAQTPPEAELKGEIGIAEYGLRARLFSQGLRKYTIFFSEMNTTILGINQLRFKMNPMPFEDPYVSPCGKAPYYAAFLNLILKKKNSSFDTDNYQVKAKVLKNKAGSPVDFTFIMNFVTGYNESLSVLADLLNRKEAVNSRGIYTISKLDFKGRAGSFTDKYGDFKTKIMDMYYENKSKK